MNLHELRQLVLRLRKRADDMRYLAALNLEAGDKFPQEIIDMEDAAQFIDQMADVRRNGK